MRNKIKQRGKKNNNKKRKNDELIAGSVREREWSHHTALQEVFLQSIITVSPLGFLRSKNLICCLCSLAGATIKGDVGIMCIITFIRCK